MITHKMWERKASTLVFAMTTRHAQYHWKDASQRYFFALVYISPGNSGERNASKKKKNSLLIVVGLIPLQESQ